jgi:Na+/melibiose symporter-like transporter
MWRPRFSGLWQHREFLKFWAGQTISAFGTQVTLLALPLTAALVLNASPAQMGVLAAAQRTPALLVGLHAGVWVDRSRKRPLLIAADLGRAVLLAAVPLAYRLGVLRIEPLYIVGFLVGVLDTFFSTAYFPLLLSVVHRDRIVEARSKLNVSGTAVHLAGPGLAGALVQAVTAPIAILADALSFVISALSLALMRTEELAPPPAEHRQSVGCEIVEGLHLVVRNPFLRAIAGANGTWQFFDNVVMAVLVLYITRELGLSPGMLGLVFIGGPLGFLAGNLLAERVIRWLGFGSTAMWGGIIGSAGAVLYALAGGPVLFAVSMLIVTELIITFGGGLYSITTGSLMQIVTPDQMLGRMNASFTFLTVGVAPLGALAGGFLGEVIGLRPTLIVGAIGEVIGVLWVWFSPLRTLREPPEPAESAVVV